MRTKKVHYNKDTKPVCGEPSKIEFIYITYKASEVTCKNCLTLLKLGNKK